MVLGSKFLKSCNLALFLKMSCHEHVGQISDTRMTPKLTWTRAVSKPVSLHSKAWQQSQQADRAWGPFQILPTCLRFFLVMSFGARHSSLWKFDINKIVTLHLVKWVLMPFNNTATGAKGCKYGIVGWSLTSKTYSPST